MKNSVDELRYVGEKLKILKQDFKNKGMTNKYHLNPLKSQFNTQEMQAAKISTLAKNSYLCTNCIKY